MARTLRSRIGVAFPGCRRLSACRPTEAARCSGTGRAVSDGPHSAPARRWAPGRGGNAGRGSCGADGTNTVPGGRLGRTRGGIASGIAIETPVLPLPCGRTTGGFTLADVRWTDAPQAGSTTRTRPARRPEEPSPPGRRAAQQLVAWQISLSSKPQSGTRTNRKPVTQLRSLGAHPPRSADRAYCGLLFQLPPRTTRRPVESGPGGSSGGERT